MQSNNPVFNRMPEFSRDGYATFDARSRQGAATSDAASPQTLEQMYAQPAAGPKQTGRMTYDDVIMRTGMMFAVMLPVAGAAWFIPQLRALWIVGLVGGLVLGLVNAFKKEPSPPLILGYAAFQGLFLGGISYWINSMVVASTGGATSMWDSVVLQAVLATLGTFGVMLALYKSGKIRVTPKFTRIMILAVAGYAVFCLVNLGLALFTGMNLRMGAMGLLIGAVGVVLASLSLTLDFDFIDRGVRQGIPAKYAWTAAFGLTVTLIWLYIEFLRILAILRGGD